MAWGVPVAIMWGRRVAMWAVRREGVRESLAKARRVAARFWGDQGAGFAPEPAPEPAFAVPSLAMTPSTVIRCAFASMMGNIVRGKFPRIFRYCSAVRMFEISCGLYSV